MKALVFASALLFAQPVADNRAPVPQPPLEYQSLAPLTVTLSLGDVQWVNAVCEARIGRPAGPGMIYEACAGVGQKWIIVRHGALYPDDRMGQVVSHETGHVRRWFHG